MLLNEHHTVYGFIDESGTPGTSNGDDDYFAVSIVLFYSKQEVESAINAIDELARVLRLPADYEFHCSRNTTKSQDGFFNVLPKLDFRFISIIIKKDDFRSTSSYSRMADLLLSELGKRYNDVLIEMDSNPAFHSTLKRNSKKFGFSHFRIRERSSRSNRLIQLADYVVYLSSRQTKHNNKTKRVFSIIKPKAEAIVVINKK